MKKTIAIVYAFLALFFFSKELICYASSSTDSYSAIDLNEKESETEKGEKDLDTKEGFEEGKLTAKTYSFILNYTNTDFFCHQEKQFSVPYTEICSPPPELA